jgi:hypothetical protein
MFRAGGRLEDEHVGEVQAAIVAGELELVGAEVVRHFAPPSRSRCGRGRASAADEVEQGGVDLGGMGLNVSHHAALRQLSNRLVGIMPESRTVYDEHTAWRHHVNDQQAAA